MANELSVRDLLDVLEKVENRVNSYWNFYMLVVIASVGWLMSAQTPFTVRQGGVLTIGLIVFFAGNLAVIRAATNRLAALESELMAQSASGAFASHALKGNLARPAMVARLPLSYAMHLLIDAGLIFALWRKIL